LSRKVSNNRHNLIFNNGTKKYQKENNTKIKEYKNEYERNRKIIDPSFKLRKNCSRLVNHALRGSKSGQSILKHLSYTMKELKDHLEKQFDSNMSWNNYGSYWHIDHVYPQSLLPYTSMNDDNFKKCWALSNLQPLEATENMRKSNKIVEILCL
jgi:membrane-associated HD superfamily phosphohydrolase